MASSLLLTRLTLIVVCINLALVDVWYTSAWLALFPTVIVAATIWACVDKEQP